jgi:hypothetical protein
VSAVRHGEGLGAFYMALEWSGRDAKGNGGRRWDFKTLVSEGVETGWRWFKERKGVGWVQEWKGATWEVIQRPEARGMGGTSAMDGISGSGGW